MKKIGSETLFSFSGEDNYDGSYSFSMDTATLTTGEWYIYPTFTHSFYNNIELSDLIDFNGDFLPSISTLLIDGEISPEFYFTMETGKFSNNALNEVTSGTMIYLDIQVENGYYNPLSVDDVNIYAELSGNEYSREFRDNNVLCIEQGHFQIIFPTSGIKYDPENYIISITIEGGHFQTFTSSFIVEIIPTFPDYTFQLELIPAIALFSMVLFSIIFFAMRKVHHSIIKNPESVKKLSTISIIFLAFSLVLMVVAAFTLISIPDYEIISFLITIIALGGSILLFFFWFFKLIYTRIAELNFKLRYWFMALILSGLVITIIAINLVVANNIEWFFYKMSLDTSTTYGITYPTLFWDLIVSSFATGFLLVVITAAWEVRSTIRSLKEVKKNIEQGYYPKEPNKLFDEVASETSSSFNSLLKSFVLWYIIIIFTFFNVFELFRLVNFDYFLIAVFIPASLVGLIFFRGPILSIIISFLPIDISGIVSGDDVTPEIEEQPEEPTEPKSELSLEEDESKENLDLDLQDG